jgi:hypothetical protein
MAKVSAKKAAPAPAKKVSTPRKPKATVVAIDKACEQALNKLKELNLEPQLQAEIAWCLGSYRYDQNPIGLFQTGAKAIDVLSAAKAKPAKIISDLKKALKQD